MPFGKGRLEMHKNEKKKKFNQEEFIIGWEGMSSLSIMRFSKAPCLEYEAKRLKDEKKQVKVPTVN
jgi:hypothetical protein